MINVFVSVVTPRLEYTTEFISKFWGVSIALLTDPKDAAIHINYSHQVIEGALHIVPHGLLEERGWKAIRPNVRRDLDEGLPYFFESSSGQFHFDVLSLTFYLLSRYEEYDPSISRDEHGRYPAHTSLAYRYGFLDIALIDRWLVILKEKLILYCPEVFPSPSPPNTSTITLTYDIDFPWAFLYRPWYINSTALVKDLLWRRDPRLFYRRLKTMLTQGNDPYDAYSLMQQTTQLLPDQVVFLLMRSGTVYDRQRHLDKASFRQLVQTLDSQFEIGLHPSYYSTENPKLLEEEDGRMRDMIDPPISKGRMHYLRIKLPETYRMLLRTTIREDYSMGYSLHSGFRSSTSHKHKWYDLYAEHSTDITLIPLIFMDTTYILHKDASIVDAQITLEQLMHEVAKHSGHCCILWHNNYIAAHSLKRQWHKLYLWSVEQIRHNTQ